MKINKKEIYIYLLVFIFWLFTQFIYTNFLGSLADQELYLSSSGPTNENLSPFSNTNITFRIYSIISLFLPGKLSILVPIMFSAVFLFRTLNNIYFYLSRTEKTIVLLSLLTPHYWIWQATASKEAIVVPLALVSVYYIAKSSVFKLKLEEKLITFVCFIGVSLLKIQNIPAYLIIFLSLNISKFTSYIKEFRRLLTASIGVYFIAAISTLSALILFLLTYFREKISLFITQIMLIGKLHFLSQAEANTSRFNLEWTTVYDFFNNMSWGIPASFLGLLPSEIINNPINFLLFIEGLYSLFIFIVINFLTFQLALNFSKVRFLYFFGLIPAIVILIIIQYSMGIFNAGTAIRYKQNIIPLIIYLPIYLIGFYRKKRFFDRKNKSFLSE